MFYGFICEEDTKFNIDELSDFISFFILFSKLFSGLIHSALLKKDLLIKNLHKSLFPL